MSKSENATPEDNGIVRLDAALGGRARAEKLDPEERRAIAKDAAEARWGSVIPKATHSGPLVIGESKLSCAVLENGKRVLTQETFLTAIGRAEKAKAGTGSESFAAGVPPFLAAENLQEFISDELRQAAVPIPFRSEKGGRAYGYDAALLPKVCEVYLTARDKKRIRPGQRHIVAACDILMRGLAHVGIIALVDEATGYQAERAKDELAKILAHYISAELLPWVRTFPEEFFCQVYRLHGWEYKPGTAKRTPLVGKLINKYIYEQLPNGVLTELRERNPVTEKGYRRRKHFQYLSADTGHPHLDKQITVVTTLMRVANNREEFEELFDRAFPKPQPKLPLVIIVPPAETP